MKHPAPNTPVKTVETSPGNDTNGPVRFDVAGDWNVRCVLREGAVMGGAAVVRAITVAAGVSLAALAACTSDASSSSSSTSSSSGGSCPEDLPAACPVSPPSYARDVAPVIQQACTPCHAPGGRESSRLLTDYANAYASRGPVLNQVHACRMPPREAPPLGAEGRKILLEWLVCGAPNN